MSRSHKLPQELTIYTASECRVALLAALELAAQDQTLVLDAADVCEVDGAGVQLLVSLSNALRSQQRSLALTAPAQALVDACRALGAADLCEAAA